MTQNGNSTHTVQRYVEFWNAASPDEQRKLAAATFADQIAYHAPVGILHGVDELIGFRNQFAEHSPAMSSGHARNPTHITIVPESSGS